VDNANDATHSTGLVPPWARRWIAALAGLLALIFGASLALAQPTPRTLADSLEAARRQRLALEAQVERQLASGIAERARTLAMSNEAAALQRLEALLDSAQARLLAQRDRIRVLRDAARLGDKAILVVLVRSDVAPDGELGASVLLDGAQAKMTAIPAERTRSMGSGTAEELYRGEVTPSTHRVTLAVTGRGLNLTESLSFPVNPREVRYVEFAIRSGRLVPTTWTARAP
jgi:hypothetical protein